MNLGLQLVMIIGIPSWSLIPGTIVDFNKGRVSCEEQVQGVIYSSGFTYNLFQSKVIRDFYKNCL